MKLSIKALAWTSGILMALSLFLVGVLNLIWPSYEGGFLGMMKSLYPGYEAMSGFLAVIVGTLYALVDGLVCGAIFAWLYNKLLGSGGASAA